MYGIGINGTEKKDCECLLKMCVASFVDGRTEKECMEVTGIWAETCYENEVRFVSASMFVATMVAISQRMYRNLLALPYRTNPSHDLSDAVRETKDNPLGTHIFHIGDFAQYRQRGRG